jgi:hypothetical protein
MKKIDLREERILLNSFALALSLLLSDDPSTQILVFKLI